MAEFRVLGPVEASVDGEPIRLPAAKPRALLAALLLDRNRVVSVSRLIDDLWGEAPPETATKALQGYVSQLRKVFGPERLMTKPPGYELRVENGELDLDGSSSSPARGGNCSPRGTRRRLQSGSAKRSSSGAGRRLPSSPSRSRATRARGWRTNGSRRSRNVSMQTSRSAATRASSRSSSSWSRRSRYERGRGRS